MSLTKNNLLPIVKKQYLYKLQSCSKFFLVMVIVQIIGILFSISNMISRSYTSDGILTFALMENTTTQIFIFTIICAFGGAIVINLKEAKNIDFTFVSNRISSNLSSIAFLITYALFGAITFPLSACFIRVVKYFLIGNENIFNRGFVITPAELLCSSGTTFLYILFFTSITYFSIILLEKSKAFIIVFITLPVLLPRTEYFSNMIKSYGSEHNFLIFAIKVLVTSIIFFLASIIISNNMEVRK